MIRKGRRGGSISVRFAGGASLLVEVEEGLGGRLSCVDGSIPSRQEQGGDSLQIAGIALAQELLMGAGLREQTLMVSSPVCKVQNPHASNADMNIPRPTLL